MQTDREREIISEMQTKRARQWERVSEDDADGECEGETES